MIEDNDEDYFTNTSNILDEILLKYSSLEKQNEPIIENEELNETNLSEYIKNMKTTNPKAKYYNQKQETNNYTTWEFDYDGHQSFYILFDKKNKYWYAVCGGGDFHPDIKYKNLRLKDFDLVKSGRYWYNIWCSKYIVNILDIIFDINKQD